MAEFLLHHWAWTGVFVFSGMGFFITEFKMRAGLKMLNTQEVVRLMNEHSVFVLDVRRPNELALTQNRSIPKAMHVPLSTLLKDRDAVKEHAHKIAVVVCQKGDRAYSAWSMLTAAGFKIIYTLEGGLNAWIEAGLPMERLHQADGRIIEGEVLSSEVQG